MQIYDKKASFIAPITHCFFGGGFKKILSQTNFQVPVLTKQQLEQALIKLAFGKEQNWRSRNRLQTYSAAKLYKVGNTSIGIIQRSNKSM